MASSSRGLSSAEYQRLLTEDDDTSSHSLADRDPVQRSRISPRTPMQKQMALQAALKVDPGVTRFSWAAMQMYLVTLVICCCSGDSGFDGTVMGGINSMKQFQDYFGMSGVGGETSIVFGIYTVGSICGTTPASYLPDRSGRRFSMFFGNAILIIGALITANAQGKGMFLGGRFLTGLGGTCSGASAKSYLAEIAPAHSRGAYLGFLNSFYYVGQMAATGLMVSTGRWESEMSWRLPLYIQAIPAIINVSFIFLCPESPRWLYSIGKAHQARQIIAKFHSSNNDINSPLVEVEMREIEDKIEVDGVLKKWWDYRALFATRADRYRAYMVILIGSFGQLSGNGLVTYFLPILLKNAGIISQDRRLTLNFVNSITSYMGGKSFTDFLSKHHDTLYQTYLNLPNSITGKIFRTFSSSKDRGPNHLIVSQGSATVDRYGRRKILLLATSVMVVLLAIVTGLLSSIGSAARANAGITFIYLFMVVYSFGWTPMQALYPAEVLSYEARAKGLAFLGIVAQGASLINTFGLPIALQSLGWKVYLIFLIWDVVEVFLIHLFVVETKGLTLEEINEVFEDPNPRAYSERLQKETEEARERGERLE
ncbi:hypothetical protein GALMADRAFT_279081 [Galerina marginata CBS 339.88]|uniref:Major facilitator superfamily (MFS) profile domain-containing protein n=1 Tax=Galerina marginata (strain CBS 339.88) TaxID=685588 RepID=A0A067T2F1_GALM3|nr:hypothetical protein GALMADRAFT_279081 [Galerina marginata CBS 339.88]